MALNSTVVASLLHGKGRVEAYVPSFLAAVQTSEWQPAAIQFRTEDVTVSTTSWYNLHCIACCSCSSPGASPRDVCVHSIKRADTIAGRRRPLDTACRTAADAKSLKLPCQRRRC